MGVNLDRTSKIGWKIQAAEGTAETLAAADFAVSVANDKESLIPGVYARESKTGSLTKRADIMTSRQLSLTGDLEMIGGSASVEPKWGEVLRACGFAVTGLKIADVGALADESVFNLGDRIGNNASEGSATKKGVVVAYLPGSPDRIVFRPTAGTWADADVAYNYADAGASTLTLGSAPAAAGFGYTPLSETDTTPTTPLTMGRIADGQYTLGQDMRCTGSIKYEFGKIPMFSIEAQGVLVLDNNGDNQAVPSLGTIPSPGAAPLPCKGMPVTLNTKADGTGFTPIMSQAEIKIGNSVTMRGTITDVDYASSGFVGSRITDRAPVLTIDPENDKTGLLAVRRTMLGATFKASLRHGLTTHGNGQVTVYAPAAQMSGNLDTSDKDGISTKSLNIKLTGNNDDEAGIYVVFA